MNKYVDRARLIIRETSKVSRATEKRPKIVNNENIKPTKWEKGRKRGLKI